MGVIGAWFTTVILVLAGMLVLHHLGLNMGALVGASLHFIEHALGRTLFIG